MLLLLFLLFGGGGGGGDFVAAGDDSVVVGGGAMCGSRGISASDGGDDSSIYCLLHCFTIIIIGIGMGSIVLLTSVLSVN